MNKRARMYVGGTLLSGLRSGARVRIPPDGLSVVYGECWVHFHPLRLIIRIFPLRWKSTPSTSPFRAAKADYSPATRSTFTRLTREKWDPLMPVRIWDSVNPPKLWATMCWLSTYLPEKNKREENERERREREKRERVCVRACVCVFVCSKFTEWKQSQSILFLVRWAEMPGVMRKEIHVDTTCHGTSIQRDTRARSRARTYSQNTYLLFDEMFERYQNHISMRLNRQPRYNGIALL